MNPLTTNLSAVGIAGPYTTIHLAVHRRQIAAEYPHEVVIDPNPFRDRPCSRCGGCHARDTALYGFACRRCSTCGATWAVAKAERPYGFRCDACGRGFHDPVSMCPTFDCPGTVRPA